MTNSKGQIVTLSFKKPQENPTVTIYQVSSKKLKSLSKKFLMIILTKTLYLEIYKIIGNDFVYILLLARHKTTTFTKT